MVLPNRVAQELVLVIKQICRSPVFASGMGEEHTLLKLILRAIHNCFDCDASSLFLWKRSKSSLTKVCGIGDYEWDDRFLVAFFHNQKPQLPEQIVMAPLRRGRMVAGVVALARKRGFQKGVGRIATEFLKITGCFLGMAEESRIQKMCFRLNQAISSGVNPKDVIYRIMHDLRKLIDYDHGATLLLRKDSFSGVVVARQVGWKKGKSEIVGRMIKIDWSDWFREVRVIDEDQRLIESVTDLCEKDGPLKKQSIVGFILDDDEPMGLFEIGSSQSDFFVDKDLRIVERFLPIVQICVRTMQRGLLQGT